MKTKGNYLNQQQQNFPLDAEGLYSIQQNIAAVELLGRIAGDKAIISGCKLTENSTYREAGWCWLKTTANPDGELLPWIGGAVADGFFIKSEAVEVQAEGYNYPQAYTERVLAPGTSPTGEQYQWADFHETESTEELRRVIDAQAMAIAQIKAVPAGVIEMWAGGSAPEGYLLCNGQSVKQSDYPALWAAIGNSYATAPLWNGVNNTSPGTGYFNLPDLRGRFVVGVNQLESDYKINGKGGGAKMVALTMEQMPKHSHSLKFQEMVWGDNATTIPFPKQGGASGYTAQTEEAGGGQSHENRPPYYALAYIIKAK
ncbi:MAG: tail fiber protein [Muribaculaceae bacterium]|nr:tail fiber protein [Muribaculaceae bacterium]